MKKLPEKKLSKKRKTSLVPVKYGDASALLKMAVNKDLDIDKLKNLIELKVKEEDRFAKKEFDYHFALMQKDFIPAQKSKSVVDGGGKLLYSYCPLENILKTYQPIISEHGFGYRWTEESISEGKGIKVSCIVSGYGHTDKTPVEIPVIPPSKLTNAVQQRGSMSTYGKRYSFMDAFGIIIEEEDDDVRSVVIKQTTANVKSNKQDKITITEGMQQKSVTVQCITLINGVKDANIKIALAKKLNSLRNEFVNDENTLNVKVEVLNSYILDIDKHKNLNELDEIINKAVYPLAKDLAKDI